MLVDDIYVVLPVHSYSSRAVELAITGAFGVPLTQEFPRGIEDSNPVVQFVCYIESVLGVECHSNGRVELVITCATPLAELAQVFFI